MFWSQMRERVQMLPQRASGEPRIHKQLPGGGLIPWVLGMNHRNCFRVDQNFRKMTGPNFQIEMQMVCSICSRTTCVILVSWVKNTTCISLWGEVILVGNPQQFFIKPCLTAFGVLRFILY